jgi:uncharacterized glyoxalase superfamily protein PhnB
LAYVSDQELGPSGAARDRSSPERSISKPIHFSKYLFDEKQAQTVDQVEVGRRISGQIRFALQVPDLNAAMKRLQARGATVVHAPVITPWGDKTARFQDPDGMQITLYQTPAQS